ncbi:extracellular solute-binding protein [Mesorhizobium sp. XAP10]|uniref:extracellular solute-binding protein n=1 Tax=unclassified Mesorhizobium TaxID=325217 RepID=UPI0023DFD264|nr:MULTISPECIES: extracellular solute-binding protein [unclassified Mesorhizobium]MDF3153880.1 extracellular solute-binding protein [Mesorhizobium sp. XAP10]MDF3247351.1 extracellular solute-binding protein [Mesorhizobium sp. XAP4]
MATLLAANQVSRRTVLNGIVAAGATALASPLFIRGARASSGQVNVLGWAEELPDSVTKKFTAATGIEIKITPFSSNEEQMNKLMATEGEGFDLCQPTVDRAAQFKDLGVLAPIDPNKIPIDDILPAVMQGMKAWQSAEGLFSLPHCWGTEAIGWRSDLTKLDYKTLSYGTLWREEYVGKVQGKPDTLLLGIGLWFDASGKLPSNRMLDSYKDEPTMRKIFDEILKFAVAHKAQIKQFFDTSDLVKSGFMENGCVIGQVWDGPALSLKKEGKPIQYMAPQEGAQSWIDGLSVVAASKNVEQAYEFLKFLYTPEVSAMVAEGSGYNGVMKGADAFLSAETKKSFAEAYPEDALSKLWSRPEEPGWYGAARNEYAEKFKAA